MHLANGTLANDVCTATAALSAAAIAYSLHRARRSATPSRIGKAVLGSLIVLGAQALDVTLLNNMTVHVIGAAFLVLLAGPALAMLGMAAVIVAQALVLSDGGVAVLGANVLNLGVVAVAAATACLRLAGRRPGSLPALLAPALLAGTVSVAAAISAMAAELAFSGVSFQSVLAITIPAHAPFIAWETATTLLLVLLAAYARAIEPLAGTTSTS